jgi:hypothetical protein
MAEDYDIDYADFDAERWHRICEDCFSKRPLFPNESRFVEDMIARTLQGHKPSAAQQKWLVKIYYRK